MKTLMTATLFTMLLMAGVAFAAERPDLASVPPKGIEGPDVHHAQMEGRYELEWPHVR